MKLADLIHRYGGIVSFYPEIRPTWAKGIFYLALFGLPLIFELYFLKVVIQTVGWDIIEFAPFLLTYAILAGVACYVVLARKEDQLIATERLEIGCLGRILFIAFVPFVLQFYFCRFFWLRAKFHLLPPPIAQLATQDRKFGLYLRSFSHDDISAAETVSSFTEDPFRYSRAVAATITVQDRVEQIVGNRIARYLPIVCIGRQNERYPISSFARLFLNEVAQLKWHDIVHELMQMAHVIIARVADTPGLQWELNILRRPEMKQRTILLFVTKYGLPFLGHDVRRFMSSLDVDLSRSVIPTETYFCVFDERGAPTFLPAAEWKGHPNSYVRLARSSKQLISHLLQHRPMLLTCPSPRIT